MNHRPIPSYQDLQSHATAGKYGKIPGRHLGKLNGAEAAEELQARGEQVPRLAGERKESLKGILRGVIRVPALLALDPTAKLEQTGLGRFQILPTEPLHDLKGHLSHVLSELQRHLPQSAAEKYNDILTATVNRQHSRGCDWREAVCLLAIQADTWEECPAKVKTFLREFAEISGILYAGEEKRTPKMVLRLTLLLWHHFVILKEVIGVDPKLVPSRPSMEVTSITSCIRQRS